MTFKEWWKEKFVSIQIDQWFDIEPFRETWNTAHIEGQKAMRERVQASTQDAIKDFRADSPYTQGYLCALEDVACGVSAMPIEGE